MDMRQLLALAHDRSAESRRILFENISDLFVSAEGRLSERERTLMGSIVSHLVHEVEMPVRRALAERLASASHAPHELIVTLANDEIQIADPILRRSGVLKDADLVEIVRHRTQEHRVAIATREQLSPDVTQALLDSGDTDAIEALINNHDVEITRRAMDYLVGESQRVDSFQQPLLRRPDIPPQLAHRMFWWASAALREYILTNFRIDEVTLDSILHETTEKVVRQAEAERSTYADAEFVVAEIANRGQLNERFLLQCLRRGRLAAFTAAIAKMAGINIELARRIIFDPGGEALAVLCKASGIERSVFSSIFLLTREAREGSRVTDPTHLNAMLKLYDGLVQTEAANALKCWQLNADYVQAVDDIRASTRGPGRWGVSATRTVS
jgi:uncharacterized protein (DUF2336 family)